MKPLKYKTIKEIYIMVLKHKTKIKIFKDCFVVVPPYSLEPYVWDGKCWKLDYGFYTLEKRKTPYLLKLNDNILKDFNFFRNFRERNGKH